MANVWKWYVFLHELSNQANIFKDIDVHIDIYIYPYFYTHTLMYVSILKKKRFFLPLAYNRDILKCKIKVNQLTFFTLPRNMREEVWLWGIEGFILFFYLLSEKCTFLYWYWRSRFWWSRARFSSWNLANKSHYMKLQIYW